MRGEHRRRRVGGEKKKEGEKKNKRRNETNVASATEAAESGNEKRIRHSSLVEFSIKVGISNIDVYAGRQLNIAFAQRPQEFIARRI